MTGSLFLDSLHDLWEGFIAFLPSFLTGLLVILVFYLIARVVRFIARRSLRRVKVSELALSLVSTMSFICVIIIGVLVSLSVMGVNAGAMVASLGLVSVGVGFALKGAIENFVAGIIVILQKPFEAEDSIHIGDVEGVVEEVRIKDTVIRMYDGRIVFVPNSVIFKKEVVNNTRNRRRRLDFDVGISYSDDTGAAMRAAAEALPGVEGALSEPSPLVVVKDLEESAVGLRVYFWIDPVETNLLEAKSEAIAAVKNSLDEAGVEIPFPIVTVRPRRA